MSSLCVRCFVALSILSGLAGCSGSGGSVDSVAVTGTVTFKGAPLEGATVTFSPQEQGKRAAFGDRKSVV